MKRKKEIVIVVEYEMPDEEIYKHAEDSGDAVLFFNKRLDEALNAEQLESDFNWFAEYDKMNVKVLDFKERTIN